MKSVVSAASFSQLKHLILPAVAFAALIGAAPAKADQSELTISYKAYKLESQAGAEDVYTQIKRAVKNYCVTPGVRPVQQHQAERECIARTLNAAIREVSSRRLTRLHKGEASPNVAP